MTKKGQKMAKKWPKMAKNGQKMAKNGQKMAKMAKMAKKCQAGLSLVSKKYGGTEEFWAISARNRAAEA